MEGILCYTMERRLVIPSKVDYIPIVEKHNSVQFYEIFRDLIFIQAIVIQPWLEFLLCI